MTDSQPDERSAATLRTRLALLVHLAASAGQFSAKLSEALERTTDAEIRIMSDLVDRGLTIDALVHLLQGAHLLIGDDTRYEAWIFPTSRRRLSSHHRNIDKRATPDYGIDGPLVREALHGRATVGTWVQFERTKATFHWGQLPTWHDILHLRDFVIYRITGKNVGPWGLSANVDTRPILLRSPHRTPGMGAAYGLSVYSQIMIAQAADESGGAGAPASAAWLRTLSPYVPPVGAMGGLYLAPGVGDATTLLPEEPWSEGVGEGLFGSLAVLRWRTRLPAGVSAVLDVTTAHAVIAADDGVETEPVTLRVRGTHVVTRSVRVADAWERTVASPDQEPGLPSVIEPEPASRPATAAGPADIPPTDQPAGEVADVAGVPSDPASARNLHAQLVELAELVRTGPVRLGAYTQAELAVVLGDAPVLRGSSPEVLAEAARSLAARGVLFRDPGSEAVTVVGDLGLILSLAPARIGTLEIRRGHASDDPREPWRWLLTVLPLGVVAVDRVDALGLHRLSVHSAPGLAEVVAGRLLGGPARLPRDEPPVAIDEAQSEELLTAGRTRWQLLLRLPRSGGAVLTVEAHVVRTAEHRVDLLTRAAEGPGFTRAAVDARSLRQFLVDLFAVPAGGTPA